MNIIYIWLIMIFGALLLGFIIGIIRIVIKVKRIKREKEQLKISRQILEEQKKQNEIIRQQNNKNL